MGRPRNGAALLVDDDHDVVEHTLTLQLKVGVEAVE